MKTAIRNFSKIFIALALLGALGLVLARSASAAPETSPWFTVTSVQDNTTSDSDLTLREALLIAFDGTNSPYGLGRPLTDAETNKLSGCHYTGYAPNHWWIDSFCGGNAAETIAFYLPNCPCTLAPTTALPFVASNTTIDGYTAQPGATVNTSKKGMNAKIMIRLYGGNIAANNVHGLDIGNNVQVRGLEIYSFSGAGINATSGNDTIVGNIIDGNAADGIALYGTNNHIGGNALADRNSIYENGWHGVEAFGASTGNQIVNNLLGVVPDGEKGTGNTFSGISIYSSSNYIKGNAIAYNGDNGVLILGGTHNNFYNNSFHDNGKQAVDLGNNGLTKNDNQNKDSDTGANNLQNFPVLASAAAANKTIKGKLVSTPNATIQIDFFKSGACDANSYGEGKTHLGSTTVNTNGNGVAKFTAALNFKAGNKLTAVASGADGTSEFSKCLTAQ